MPEGFLPPLVVEIVSDAKQFSAGINEAVSKSGELEKESSSSFSKVSSVGRAAFLGLGTAAVALGAAAVHLGDQWENAHVAMVAAISKTGASFSQFQKPIAAVDKRMQSLGFTYADTESGMTALVEATGSTSKSLSLMGLTADAARVQNISLAQAGVLVAKASEGQGRALKALGINVNTATGGARALITSQRSLASAQLAAKQALENYNAVGGKTVENHQALVSANLALKHSQESYNDVVHSGSGDIGLLTKSIGGQAQAAAGTFAGRMRTLKAETEDMGAKLGMVLIPKLEDLVNITMSVVSWLGKHKDVAIALGAVIGGVLTAVIAVYVAGLVVAAATSVATFATMVAAALSWAASMVTAGAIALLPFAPLILIVAAVGVAAYELYKHWDQVWGFIKTIAADAVNFVKSHLLLIISVALGPIGIAAMLLYRNWNTIWSGIKSVTSAVWNVLSGVFSKIIQVGITPIKVEIAVLKTAWSLAWDGIRTVVEDAWDGLKRIFDDIVSGASKVVSVVSKVASVASAPGKAVGFVKGLLANGGTANESGLYVVGERGPELVMLPGGSNVMSNGNSKRFLAAHSANPAGSVSGFGGSRVLSKLARERATAGLTGNYTTTLNRTYSRSTSYLAATTAPMVHTVLAVDGKVLYDTVQKQALRTSLRNGAGVGNGLSTR